MTSSFPSHLHNIDDLSREQIVQLLDTAQRFINDGSHLQGTRQQCSHTTVATAFFEDSTRTQMSFELAAMRQGATLLRWNVSTSAMNKGETELDTFLTLQAMGVNCFVIRHKAEHVFPELMASCGDKVTLLNAGSGSQAHPSQALLDMLTIRQHKKDFSQCRMIIAGDIKHSRVARSDIQALKKLGIGELCLVAPQELIPDDAEQLGVAVSTDFDQALSDCDVVMMLRVQRERIANTSQPDAQDYYKHYGLTPERLQLAKPDAIVMHPGPMNRGVEIADSVADGEQSVILQQVENGVAIRMAILELFCQKS